MDIERINQLFSNGIISSDEHNFLITKVTEREEKQFSIKAILALIIPLMGYLLILTFTFDGQKYGLVPNGDARMWIIDITSVLGVIFYILAKSEIKTHQMRGLEIANFGLGIAFTMLVISIPVHLAMVIS